MSLIPVLPVHRHNLLVQRATYCSATFDYISIHSRLRLLKTNGVAMGNQMKWCHPILSPHIWLCRSFLFSQRRRDDSMRANHIIGINALPGMDQGLPQQAILSQQQPGFSFGLGGLGGGAGGRLRFN
jgi:hypothetical protein